MAIPSLKIGSVEFALQTFPMSQEYRPLVGATLQRMLSGTGYKQQHWAKLATRIGGAGWAPAALAGVDWSSPVDVYCIEPRAIHSGTNVATIPSARRTDIAEPVLCRAVVGGELVETPVVVVSNTATATTVSGATSYQFMYWPKLSMYSDGPVESLDATTGTFSWSLDAEEV